MNKVLILGIGPGGPDYLLPITKKKISNADILIGGRRALELFPESMQTKIEIKANLAEIKDYIKANYQRFKLAVLLSGDSCFYSLLTYLREDFSEEQLEVIPGISSIQLLFARSGLGWQEAKFISLHGRKQSAQLIQAVKSNQQVGVLTDRHFSPELVAELLVDEGLGQKKIIVGENLSYPEERLIIGQAEQISKMEFAPLTVMLICGQSDYNG